MNYLYYGDNLDILGRYIKNLEYESKSDWEKYRIKEERGGEELIVEEISEGFTFGILLIPAYVGFGIAAFCLFAGIFGRKKREE